MSRLHLPERSFPYLRHMKRLLVHPIAALSACLHFCILAFLCFLFPLFSKGQEVKLGLPVGHTDYVNSAVYSPDGRSIVTASLDNTARIWDAVTGKLLHSLEGHTDDVNSAVYSPDGRSIVTASWDNTARIWDATTGQARYTRLQLKNNDWLVYDEHYRFDGTPGAIEKLYFVCGLEVIELSQVKRSLRVIDLVKKIMNNTDLSSCTKLSDLDICGKLPIVERAQDAGNYTFIIEKRVAEIVRIEVYLGKKRIKIIDPASLSWSKNKATLALDPGEIEALFSPGEENTLKVQAVALISGKEIPDRGATATVEDQRERKTPKVYGLFVGVNEYNDENLTLRFPGNDALSLSHMIAEGTGAYLGKEKVKIYTIHSEYSVAKQNGYGTPTRNTIRKAIQEIAAQAEPQDVLFIFLAGHGTMGEETDQKFTFLTSEASMNDQIGITTDTLFSWIATDGPFKLKANKAVLILDACNSAQLLNDVAMRRSTEEEERQKQLDQLSDRSGLFILSAAAPNKSAYEYPRLEHGLLTYSLLRVLKQNPSIYEQDEFVNMTKWFYESSRDLEKLTQELNLEQEATPSGTGDFQIMKLNEETRSKIKLAEEKQQLFFGSAENETDEIPDPELIKRIVKKIDRSEQFKTCFYTTKEYSKEALMVNLKYSQKGTKIACRVLLYKDNKKVAELMLHNKEGDWESLEFDILDAVMNGRCE